ncbi:cellulase family glycosylhydrolase [Actinoplanes sp. HUAS TT8]|uniref:cellulase family glycosylhydrolase n=1 Tax=Actinoplanes sp. HUAS TT8 TaxID=3447453 RepID=UPI003F51DEB1
MIKIRRVLLVAALILVGTLLVTSTRSGESKTPHTMKTGIAYGDTLVWMSDEQLNQALDDAADLGATWIRADLSWDDIQGDGPDTYRWELFDRVLAAAQKRGLQILPVLAYTPGWARVSDCGEATCAPADPAAFARFADAAARRYAPRGLHVWEIWNEPNLGFWKPAPDPSAYARLLQASSRAIRAVDAGATLVMGGLVPTGNGPGQVSPEEFITVVLREAGDVVDAIGYHPYTYPHLASDHTLFGTSWDRIGKIRDALDAAGHPDMPLWLTETGAPTGGPGNASDGSSGINVTHVTEERQAAIAADVVTTAATTPLVDAVFWYSDRDLGTDSSTSENFFGLRRADGSAKPAYAALRNAMHSAARY